MWPFSSSQPRSSVHFRRIDDDYAVAGQIGPGDLQAVSDAGFKALVCARPDGEEGGQPTFDEVAREAERLGLQIVHVPVSGPLRENQLIRFEEAMARMPRPVLGYCRSGARAGSLYAALRR